MGTDIRMIIIAGMGFLVGCMWGVALGLKISEWISRKAGAAR